MRIEEAVGYMSKAYLHRVIDSFTKDLHKPDTEESRSLITRNAKDLSDQQHIAAKLRRDSAFGDQVLLKMLLESLLAADDRRVTESELIEHTQRREREIVEQAQQGDALKHKDSAKLDTYRTVLEVALEDDSISSDELSLLTRLRTHLGLRERDHFLLQAQLCKFPSANNTPHSPSQISAGLTELQKRGVVFYCNRAEKEPFHVIPEEIVPGVQRALGIQLTQRPYELMLDHLSREQLKAVLNSFDLPTSGNKKEQAERIIDSGITPAEVLSRFGVGDLEAICKSLPGVKSSGSKAEKVENIISHFGKLRVVVVGEDVDPRERYYQYFEELARRDRQNLLSNKVIGKDRDMDSAFEEATRYLFEQKLGLTHAAMAGSEHPDGVIDFGEGDALFMWDTKSKESVYTFPNNHLNQFKRYIRDSPRRVTAFLVIAPEIDSSAVENALRLKAQSGTDTDVALVAAEDLKWLADEWKEHIRANQGFTLQVLNYTGILDRQVLQQRMKLFLA